MSKKVDQAVLPPNGPPDVPRKHGGLSEMVEEQSVADTTYTDAESGAGMGGNSLLTLGEGENIE